MIGANLHEEGEPTNSVSGGGIDAPESKLGDTVHKRKPKKKKKKMKNFKQFMKSEAKLYRGYDPEYDILGKQELVWFSYDPELATLYALQSGQASKESDITVGFIEYKPQRSYNAGWDNRVIKPVDLLNDMLDHSITVPSSPELTTAKKKFLTEYDDDVEHQIIYYWNQDDNYFADLLDILDFDSVTLKEKHTRTVGILRKYIANKKGTKFEQLTEAKKFKKITGLHLTKTEIKAIKGILDSDIYAKNGGSILYNVGRKKYRISEIGGQYDVEVIENEKDVFNKMQKIKRQYMVSYE